MQGLGPTNRVVVNNNLLEKLSEQEILAVICHEFGHVALWHRFYNSLLFAVYVIVYVFLFTIFYKDENLLASFGFTYQSAPMSAFLFAMFTVPFDFFFKIPGYVFSRLFEYQADEFAVKKGHGE